ncbi:MAG TPA: HAMP domain-containing sensor histidine kinase [Candidatus Kapabacteria bacterium]|nr:HAMP domain-containing sensor histidine kinase [Candidatus Kapabacteria bacterium]
MEQLVRTSTIKLPRSANIKLILLVVSVIGVVGVLIYNHGLVEELKTREQRVAQLLGSALRYIQNAEDLIDASLYQDVVDYVRKSGVPMIITDADDEPSFTLKTYQKFNINIPFDTTLSKKELHDYLKSEMQRMDKFYPPEKITYRDPESGKEVVSNYIHFGDSAILAKIEQLPFIQLLLAMVVIIIGYLSFAYLKRSEQSNIWVGMSRETAHQLGTPLSSLLGWTEMLHLSAADPGEVHKIADEISKDIERLNRVTTRFSKIGSKPDLHKQNVVSVVSAVMGYLEGRMPRLGSSIAFSLDTTHDEIMADVNRELFEWVLENLIKNASEAIESQGSIAVKIEQHEKVITIDVIDTGKGFDANKRKEVFRPGYSTKARGWGLGLTLAKRIIEEYHHGRLYVKDSAPGKGTTFRIKLTAV